MSARDVVLGEVAGSLGILGLLLVFLPLFLQSVALAASGKESFAELKSRRRRAWWIPSLIGLAAADATLGFLTLWGKIHAAGVVGWVTIALVWLVVFLAISAVKTALRIKKGK